MTYIDYLDNFYFWIESHYLPQSSKLLFFGILHKFHKAGWPEYVKISIAETMIFIGTCSQKTAIFAREQLINAGWITCESGVRGSPTKYFLSNDMTPENKDVFFGYYNYNLDDEDTNDRNTSEYKKWRQDVLKRDNYTCQRCGRKDVKLHAHHIERFHDCVEKRTDVSNGVTLCEDCHRLVHRIEGR